MVSTAAVLLAGGSGTRLRHGENKVYLPLGGRPLMAWSLEAFDRSPLIDRLVLVVRGDDLDRARAVVDAVGPTKLEQIVTGGTTRQASEYAGVEALADGIRSGEIELVCIHDVARPFVTQALVQRVVGAARRTGGAVPGLPLPGPLLLRADDGGSARALIPTGDLRRVQTPQAFHAGALLDAYRDAASAGAPSADTSETMERHSDVEVAFVRGDPDNVKLTYAVDLVEAERTAVTWDPGGR